MKTKIFVIFDTKLKVHHYMKEEGKQAVKISVSKWNKLHDAGAIVLQPLYECD
jgi:hypothetical protein